VQEQSPPVGWAVEEPAARLETRNRRREWIQQRDLPRIFFLSALIIWNAVGIGLLLYIAFGDTNDPATTRVVFNVVFWPLLAGDLALAVVGPLGSRMRKRQRS
jgi:hypothetical protein